MKKVGFYLSVGLGIIVIIIIAYLSFVIVQARAETPQIVRKALSAGNMVLNGNDLSEWQLKALLKIEDPNFYHHHGVDLKTPGAGLTTITQALVKIYYFEHFQPGIAKIKQTLIARFVLDPLVSKDDQLRLFINNVYLGNVNDKPIIGFADAAARYYGKRVNQLRKREYLSIVAMINSPEGFHLVKRPAANAERTDRLLKVVSGQYKPKHLMDIYYGRLDGETQKYLAPASYFPSLYKDNPNEDR